MLTATFQTTPAFHAGIQGLIQKCRINSRVVVKKETGELIKMLVKVSPPKDLAKSKSQVEAGLRYKFAMAAEGGFRSFENTSGTIGPSGVKWYFVDGKFLRGVAPQSDKRKESPSGLIKLYRTLSKGGRVIVPFKHPRKRQRVMISTKILVTKGQLAKTAALLKTKFGRLKAG